MMTTSYDQARCGYCGVVHLGADGKQVVCPRLLPAPPVTFAPVPPKFCPHCGKAL